jgi:hypothetical protein
MTSLGNNYSYGLRLNADTTLRPRSAAHRWTPSVGSVVFRSQRLMTTSCPAIGSRLSLSDMPR